MLKSWWPHHFLNRYKSDSLLGQSYKHMQKYSGTEYELKISRIKMEDQGEYIVRAENSFGRRDERAKLTVERKCQCLLSELLLWSIRTHTHLFYGSFEVKLRECLFISNGNNSVKFWIHPQWMYYIAIDLQCCVFFSVIIHSARVLFGSAFILFSQLCHSPLGQRPSTNSHCLSVATSCSSLHVFPYSFVWSYRMSLFFFSLIYSILSMFL